MMKILFVNAIDRASEVETRHANLGLGYLVASLRDAFGENIFSFEIIDRNIRRRICDFLPDIVCVTSVTQNYNIAKYYASIAKEYGIPVIVGGIHISMLPHTLTADMDVGCIGEGERTIVDLMRIFISKGGFLTQDLENIKGVVYRQDGEAVITAAREHINNLDEIPFPARDLLRINKHSYMFTSRGCPYNCMFCASTKFWNKPRFFSAEYVVKEIEELVSRYNVEMISFFDDLFIGNFSRLRKIVEIIEKNVLLSKVRFTCSARANLITDDVAELLKRMRVLSVGMGLESGSEETLSYLKGENICVEDNKRAVSILRRHKISANASFVIGSPHESKEEIMKTYFFIRDNPLSLVDVYVLSPFPGTKIWADAKKRGLVSDEMDWSRLNVNFGVNFRNAVIVSEVLSRQSLIRIYRKFQILRFLKNARNVWFTPQIFDLPGIILKTCRGYIAGIFTRKNNSFVNRNL